MAYVYDDEMAAIERALREAEEFQPPAAAVPKKQAVSRKREKPTATAAPPPPVPVVAVAPKPKVPDDAKDKFVQFFMYIAFSILYPKQDLGEPDPVNDSEEMLLTKQMFKDAKEGYEHYTAYLAQERVPRTKTVVEKELPQHMPISGFHSLYMCRYFCLIRRDLTRILKHRDAINSWTGETMQEGRATSLAAIPFLSNKDRDKMFESDLPPAIETYVNEEQANFLCAVHVIYFLAGYCATVVHQIVKPIESRLAGLFFCHIWNDYFVNDPAFLRLRYIAEQFIL